MNYQAVFLVAGTSSSIAISPIQELGRWLDKENQESPFPKLTERELEVLRLIAQGHNNQEIAQKLVISPKTVRNHITSIFSKLQVADRAQAIVLARQSGLE